MCFVHQKVLIKHHPQMINPYHAVRNVFFRNSQGLGAGQCWQHIYGRRKSISWHSSIKKIWNDIVDIFIPTPVLTYIIPLFTGLSMSLLHPQILTQFASTKPAYSCQHATICLMGAR